MSDDHPGNGSGNWLERLISAFQAEPRSREELLELLRHAQQRKLIDAEALSMIEGALTVSSTQVRDVMVPRSQMVTLEHDQQLEELLPTIVRSGHSRFPVLGEDPDEVLGVLLAKDLLRFFGRNSDDFRVTDLLRKVAFIPESKRLNVLLREFRANRQHMAIVVDEYGGVSGLVTIEDVLEEIVGEIDDETDREEEQYVFPQPDGRYTIKALMPLEDFNERFGTRLPQDEFDTIGGYVVAAFGHLPEPGEQIEIGKLQFEVLRADQRRVHLFRMATP